MTVDEFLGNLTTFGFDVELGAYFVGALLHYANVEKIPLEPLLQKQWEIVQTEGLQQARKRIRRERNDANVAAARSSDVPLQNNVSEIKFRVEEYVQYDDNKFHVQLSGVSDDEGGKYAAFGNTPLEAIENLCHYLNKTDHSDETWMASLED